MVLVNRLPGLRTTTSAFSMAAITPGGAVGARRLDLDPRDRLADLAHHRLAAGHRPVGVRHHEGQALGRGREDPALYPQKAARLLHALAEARRPCPRAPR